MTKLIRACLGCNASLEGRHGNARYCASCYQQRTKQHEANRARSRVCGHCGDEFTAQSGRESYCGYRCSGLASRAKQLAAPAGKRCVACGAVFNTASTRKTTCSTACKQWARKHPGCRRSLEQPCAECGQAFTPTKQGVKYCSLVCQRDASNLRRRAGRPAVPVATVCAACSGPISAPRPGKKYCSADCGNRYYSAPARFAERFGRTCERCGAAIGDHERVTKRFCCTSCQVMHNQTVRRARRRGLPVERISRAEIFERDGMTCHICGDQITERPTIDHIVPIACDGSPGHVWENVAAAHGSCNSGKRDRASEADLALYRRLLQERTAREVSHGSQVRQEAERGR